LKSSAGEDNLVVRFVGLAAGKVGDAFRTEKKIASILSN
jgi:hypothetical protein